MPVDAHKAAAAEFRVLKLRELGRAQTGNRTVVKAASGEGAAGQAAVLKGTADKFTLRKLAVLKYFSCKSQILKPLGFVITFFHGIFLPRYPKVIMREGVRYVNPGVI